MEVVKCVYENGDDEPSTFDAPEDEKPEDRIRQNSTKRTGQSQISFAGAKR